MINNPVGENRKIKLLLSASVFVDRGAERLIIHLYNKLPKEKYEINIVCLRGITPFADYLNRNSDIKIDVIGMKNNIDIAAIFRFYKYIRHFKPDIINFHHFRAALWGRPLARLAKVPVILYSVHNKWGGKLHHFLDRTMARFTDAIIPFSYAVGNYLINDEHIQGKYIEKPIYAGIDINFFCSIKNDEIALLRKELSLADDQKVIGFIGNLNLEKGLLYLIESVKNLSSDFKDLCCLIIGDGPDEDYLKEKISEYQLSDNFVFLGPRKDINNILKLMNIFVLPSLREGLPLVILEAMAASCPVIATNIDGIPEIINHKENGWLVPPANAEELSTAIKTLLVNDKLRQEFAIKGLETVRDKFSINKMVGDYNTIYQTYLCRQS
jgi:glycosyltransferase involved in cell wall biosynthesis